MFKRKTSLIALALASTLALAACGGGTDDPETPAESAPSSSEEGAEGTPNETPINIAVFNGWDEGIAVSHLWSQILESKGYNVEMTMADPGVVFAGTAAGDYDLNFDTWLPTTHEDYLESFGDDMEDLGFWYDEATLGLAVNSDSPITSLADLADNADVFGNRIVGIDSGAGLTRLTKDEVIPTYGLEDMDYVTSSTPAMLAELDSAMRADEDIVVTLWKPHWAYDAHDIRDLEDPEGALGEAESIHTFARTGFTADYPEVAEWISNFKMDSENLFDLENLMFNEQDSDDYAPIVADWIKDNQDWVDSLTE